MFGFIFREDEGGETFLSVEEDIHTMVDYNLPYYFITTRSCSNGYEQPMKYALPLMAYLLNGYMVFTHVYVKRRQENAVEMGVKFCADYAENAAKEEVYIDGKGEMLVITKGMNQKLAKVIMNAPALAASVGYTQAAFEKMPEPGNIVDFQSAWNFLENNSVVDVQCPCAGADVHVGISSTEGAEAWLVEELLAFAKLYGTKFDFGWPEALAVAQALDSSVLANRIPFAKKPVRKE